MGASMNHTGKRSRRNRGSFTEINVTPLVDVMLVLLVIFMVTAPMLTAGVEVDLPETSAEPLKGNDEPLVVSVQKDGTLYIQEDEYALGELSAKLSAIAAENKDKRVIVRGDAAVDYGTMMEVMGEITAAGLQKVALETDIKH